MFEKGKKEFSMWRKMIAADEGTVHSLTKVAWSRTHIPRNTYSIAYTYIYIYIYKYICKWEGKKSLPVAMFATVGRYPFLDSSTNRTDCAG